MALGLPSPWGDVFIHFLLYKNCKISEHSLLSTFHAHVSIHFELTGLICHRAVHILSSDSWNNFGDDLLIKVRAMPLGFLTHLYLFFASCSFKTKLNLLSSSVHTSPNKVPVQGTDHKAYFHWCHQHVCKCFPKLC